MPHVFMLREDAKTRKYSSSWAPTFVKSDVQNSGEAGAQYHVIEDDDQAKTLRETTVNGEEIFRWLGSGKLDAVLETAEDAADAIRDGEHDDDLDLLLFAEKSVYGARTTVMDAIAGRHRELVERRNANVTSARALSPEDVASLEGV